MKKGYILLLFFVITIVSSFVIQENSFFQVPDNWPTPNYNFSSNHLTDQKIYLGRVLFYDPILSKDKTISCASCHLQYTAFTHVDHALSHGIEDKVGTRNAPSLINLAWHKSFMWDGAINHLDMQALAPIAHPAEMGFSIDSVIIRLQHATKYKKLFFEAFHDTTITGERFLKAITAFELILISSDAKYDSVLRKQSTFTVQEAKGYNLFKQNCATCHTEPLFTNLNFENNGLSPDSTLNDIGRYKISNDSNDLYKFKVPTLRNIEFSYPYMHDGRYKTLNEVLNHYSQHIYPYSNLATQLQLPINMNADQKVDIIAFLLTLTDKHFLFNSNYSYPRESPKNQLYEKN